MAFFIYMEIWKDVVGYENAYQISNYGNVKSLNYNRTNKEKILKPKLDKGYLRVVLSKHGVVKTKTIHQLVAESFLGHKPNKYSGLIVDHINNIKTDNRVNNLQLTTQRNNVTKSVKNATSQYAGVCWDKRILKWQSTIYINGRNKHLGLFTNELDAHNAYQKALSTILIPS